MMQGALVQSGGLPLHQYNTTEHPPPARPPGRPQADYALNPMQPRSGKEVVPSSLVRALRTAPCWAPALNR